MRITRALATLNFIAFAIHLLVVYLVQMRFINTKDVAEISDQYHNLFTPAPFTFAIWGIIYTLLGIFCLYHMVNAFKRNASVEANHDLRSIGAFFIINNFCTAAWLIAWTNDIIPLSVVLILFQLATLIVIHLRLGIHSRRRNPGSKLATELPLSVYLGWIAVAVTANISSLLVSLKWEGSGITPITWFKIIVIAITLLGVAMTFQRKNIAYVLVQLWALVGLKSNIETSYNSLSAEARPYLLGGMILLGICALVEIVRLILRKRPHLVAIKNQP